ncbi:MAG TPA: hypothetical protein VFT22_14915, partial [Kofleriaceae bacterium]|nr:hypothetical protein [Kofleriaceae bacterium]
DTAYAIAVQADGKIVVAGSAKAAGATGDDFALARYTASGALDATFGTGGKVTTSFGNDADTARALVVQADGKIVAGGDTSQGSATGVDFALARYTTSGALDAGFGTGGKVITAMRTAAATDSINAVVLEQVDGEARIVAAGGDGDFALARYRASGEIDTSFGASGKVLALFGSVIGAARAVAVTADGKLVVAGHRAEDFALVRLGVDGKLDTTFGTGGRVVTAIDADNSDEAQAIAIDADGKLVVAGWAYEGKTTSGNFAVVRYGADGAIDTSFAGGIVVTPVASASRRDQGMAIALQSDPRVPTVRVVVAGNASASNSDFAAARYWR